MEDQKHGISFHNPVTRNSTHHTIMENVLIQKKFVYYIDAENALRLGVSFSVVLYQNQWFKIC